MRTPTRHITALLLTAVYAMIILSPLAPVALKSPRVAHAVTGECSGNCGICGCSAERRANHTCCCWMKKLKHQHDHEMCAACCKKKSRHRMTMISCNCPCGSDSIPGIAGFEKSEQLLYRFSNNVTPGSHGRLLCLGVEKLSSLSGEPPDPPPKISFTC